ncbi:major capsid protein [Moraxella sp. ZJ142]|uniref:major capsid protein n=1 Tax=Moraxella marmotae TaxID=3344520 RepID=UPI0035D44083
MAFDTIKFNNDTYTVLTETVAQQVDKFNQQSNGAIQLVARPFRGDFDTQAAFKFIANLVRHRDIENGQNTISSARLTQHKNVAVKVAAGTPEMLWESAHYRWVLQNPEEAAIIIGEQLGRATIADMLNTAIKCGVAAIKGNTKAVETADNLDFAALTKGASRFGDRSGSIAAWVMHSGALTQLQLKALGNNERLFSYDNVSVLRDPHGRVFVVTDAPDLAVDNSGIKYNVLGLTEGGIIVNNQADFNSVIVPKTGFENITNAYQAEWSYAASVKGYTWDTAAGGSNPNSGALATQSNWKQTATSIKDTAGVLVQGA